MVSELDQARQFFLERRLFVSMNYDDDFYRFLPFLILLKADVEQEHRGRLPNICVHAPFPRKIQHILGPSLTPEDWHAALRRGWIHVVCRKPYFEASWRAKSRRGITELVSEYDTATCMPEHHTVLRDDYFDDSAARAEEVLARAMAKHGEDKVHGFASFLSELDAATSGDVRFYRGPFAEIRDRAATKNGYDGRRAARMLFRYFLNDFKQAKDLGYSDLLLPPIYIDIARHILGADPVATAAEPTPTRVWANTHLESHLVGQQEEVKHAGFWLDTVETLSKIAATCEPGKRSRAARLEEKVEYFAQYHRDAIWLLIWLLAKVSRFSLSGFPLNPASYGWRERFLFESLSEVFRTARRCRRALNWATFLRGVPGGDRLGLLDLVSRLGKRLEVRHLSPARSLTSILSATGIWIHPKPLMVHEQAQKIWADVAAGLADNEIDLILNSSDTWASLFWGMDELHVGKSRGTMSLEHIWRVTAGRN